jgi:di/tricarboxylate transporter
MLPVTIAASFSYILPVSTPPNAIVYATGDITMMDMVSAVFNLYFEIMEQLNYRNVNSELKA